MQRDRAGRIREVRTPSGAVIRHRPEGMRHVEARGPGRSHIVAEAGGRHGYVQRPFDYRGHRFDRRTYYHDGHSYARLYRPYTYGDVALDVYSPYAYYRPGFYAWAYRPWARPIGFSWGWMGSPWYAYYGGYFTPYAVYPGPAFWLTDFVLAATLEEAYQARVDAGVALAQQARGPVTLTPEVKQAIADEVRRQIEAEQAEAASAGASGMPAYGATAPIFSPNGPRVFVVSSPLEVSTSAGEECVVSEGDVLRLARRPAPSEAFADLEVLASKAADCPCGSIVSLQIQDLQEMDNHLRATVDQGLGELRSRQGQAGLPALPASAAGPMVNTSFASQVTPEANVAGLLSSIAAEALQAEQATVAEPLEPDQPPAETAVVSLGQTVEEVVGILGPPQKVVNLGAKQIYIYPDMKVTFMNGQVSDVQ